MNNILLSGQIRNQRASHKVGNIYYNTCELVQGDNVIDLVYKQGSGLKIKDDQFITTTGTVRTFSRNNHVQLYVYTYFDIINSEENNKVELDGVIVKRDNLYTYPNGKCNIHIVIKNTVSTANGEIINYIPCVARNELARQIAAMETNEIKLTGELHSRTYTKMVNGEAQFNTTHEVEVLSIESLV